MTSKTQKPNWTLIELDQKALRSAELTRLISNHDDCYCNLCMESYALDILLDCFTEGEMAMAVVATNKLAEEIK